MAAKSKTADVNKAIQELLRTKVLVGIPSNKNARKGEIGNATLGYIHEFGSPVHNIPPRPWLVPGVRASEKQWTNYLQQAAKLAIDGNMGGLDRALRAAGDVAVSSVKTRIVSGIAPPLAEYTKQRRRAKHKNTKTGPSPLPKHFGGFTPLVDTAQMLNSITYAIEKTKVK